MKLQDAGPQVVQEERPRPKASALLLAGVRENALSRRVAGEEGVALARKFCAVTPEFPDCIRARDIDVRRVLRERNHRLSQVVVVGLGLDIKPLELGSETQSWFGLDLEENLTQRAALLKERGLSDRFCTGVVADIRTPGWKEALRRAGFDAGKPTMFIVEGLSMYLGRDTLMTLLGDLRGLAEHPESVLWMDHFSREFFTLDVKSVKDFIQLIARLGEPFVTGFSSVDWLSPSRWVRASTVQASDLVAEKAPVLNEYLFSTMFQG